MRKAGNCILVIFGASGDLTYRKLIPALYVLHLQKLLPDSFAVLGTGRTLYTSGEFRNKMKEGILKFSDHKEFEDDKINPFLQKLYYLSQDTGSSDGYAGLKEELEILNKKYNAGNNYIFYLAISPGMFEVISENLASNGLNIEINCYRRIIVEKPFGYDIDSAIKLNNKLHINFSENQIYRIDHYLGKETVQNLLVTRFSNGIFEPLWNRNYVHHVEITSAESLGVENRGEYYDTSGALRDMVQNHILQIVGFTAMEPPSSIDSESIRNETLKIFQSLRPIKEDETEKNVIRGQYTASKIRGNVVPGYRDEKNVNPQSRTETYVAMKFYIDNWRWGGVPFYIRTGKRLPTRVTEIVIHFKPTPHFLFAQDDTCNSCNQLIIRVQPDEGILLKVGMKVPGSGFLVQNVNMDFHYKDLSNFHVPEAYERLLHDVMLGDSTLYARADAVEAAWKFIAPIQHAWTNNSSLKIYGYPAGTWGPEIADELIEEKGMTWRYPCKNLSEDGEYCEL